MPDARISELPAATAPADTDLAPLVQSQSGSLITRRASIAQLRGAVLTERGTHVRDYGAVGDGSTNDAPAIQAAINDLAARGGGTLFFGPRQYRLRSAIVITNTMVRLQGAGFTETGSAAQGTWFLIDNTNFVPFLFTGVTARGSAVRDIAVQQIHPTSFGASWAPTDYPYVFRVEDCLGGVDFDNVLLARVNRGIYCRNSGRLDIRRLRGQVFTAGVEIDECLDVPRIHNLHFWTFWTADDNVVRWQQANGDALIFRRSDGVFVDQAFVLGYRSMVRFAASAPGAPAARAGVTTKFYIGQAYADFVRYGVWIEADGVDGQIGGLTTQGELFNAGGTPLGGSHGILVDAGGTRVQVANLRVDDAEDHAIRVNGSGNRLDVFSLRCVFFNTRNNGAAAIHLADSGAAAPNALYLGSPPQLENGNGGPVVNPGTNGFVQMQAPAGRAGRPGLAVGAAETGLFQPAGGTLAASAGGVEVLRATDAGTLTLGAAPGGHAFEVATPGGAAANSLRVGGGIAGAPVVVQAQGADPDIGLVLSPKGSGALSAHVPDGASAGGVARGANAVDWQQSRSQPGQVASGTSAVVCGGIRNTASNTNTVVCGGQANTASAIGAAVGGGQSNTASASFAAIGGGQSNAASGTYASIGGGQLNAASGSHAWIPGGHAADARGLTGKGAWACGQFATAGDAQAGEQVLRRTSGNANPQRLTADGSGPGAANTLNLPDNASQRLRLSVLARQVGGTNGTPGDTASWTCEVLAKRGTGAATAAILGGIARTAGPGLAAITPGTGFAPDIADAGAGGWRVTVAADTTNGGIALTGTGEPGKTIQWVARVMSVETVG